MACSFTIAVPTHDRRETMLLAIRSALMQTRPPQQVLVLCDGCTDGSADAARALGDARVEVLELPKQGDYAYAHRNRSLALARGEAITWLSDDDLLLPDHLERLGEYWDRGAAELVQAPSVAVEADDALSWIGFDWGVPGHLRTMLQINTNAMSAVSVSVRAALAAGGWDERLPRAGDWDLWKRVIAAGGRCAMTSEPTVLHFRASGREQGWGGRVRQNTAWFERIADPDALAGLRFELRTLRSLREADWAHAIESLSNEVEQARHAAEGQRERERALVAELEREREDAERLREAERTLGRVYAGGWWRLRAHVTPALRLAERLRGRV